GTSALAHRPALARRHQLHAHTGGHQGHRPITGCVVRLADTALPRRRGDHFVALDTTIYGDCKLPISPLAVFAFPVVFAELWRVSWIGSRRPPTFLRQGKSCLPSPPRKPIGSRRAHRRSSFGSATRRITSFHCPL